MNGKLVLKILMISRRCHYLSNKKGNMNNKGTYTLTFTIDAESVDMAVDILHEMSFEDKLNYIINQENE